MQTHAIVEVQLEDPETDILTLETQYDDSLKGVDQLFGDTNIKEPEVTTLPSRGAIPRQQPHHACSSPKKVHSSFLVINSLVMINNVRQQ